MQTWVPSPDIGKGRIVVVSVSPVGIGTAGLLLMNGIPSSELGEGEGSLFVVVGDVVTHPSEGKEGKSPPELGGGAATGGKALPVVVMVVEELSRVLRTCCLWLNNTRESAM